MQTFSIPCSQRDSCFFSGDWLRVWEFISCLQLTFAAFPMLNLIDISCSAEITFQVSVMAWDWAVLCTQLLNVLKLQESNVFFSTLEQVFGNSVHATVSKAVSLALQQGNQLVTDDVSQFMKLAVEPESLQWLEIADFYNVHPFFNLVQASLVSLVSLYIWR